jgi:hypothetical protein
MTPDTTNYLILGYVVFSLVMGLYLISLVVRQRNLQRDLELLKELEDKDEREA